jgi:hypothetical protein
MVTPAAPVAHHREARDRATDCAIQGARLMTEKMLPDEAKAYDGQRNNPRFL